MWILLLLCWFGQAAHGSQGLTQSKVICPASHALPAALGITLVEGLAQEQISMKNMASPMCRSFVGQASCCNARTDAKIRAIVEERLAGLQAVMRNSVFLKSAPRVERLQQVASSGLARLTSDLARYEKLLSIANGTTKTRSAASASSDRSAYRRRYHKPITDVAKPQIPGTNTSTQPSKARPTTSIISTTTKAWRSAASTTGADNTFSTEVASTTRSIIMTARTTTKMPATTSAPNTTSAATTRATTATATATPSTTVASGKVEETEKQRRRRRQAPSRRTGPSVTTSTNVPTRSPTTTTMRFKPPTSTKAPGPAAGTVAGTKSTTTGEPDPFGTTTKEPNPFGTTTATSAHGSTTTIIQVQQRRRRILTTTVNAFRTTTVTSTPSTTTATIRSRRRRRRVPSSNADPSLLTTSSAPTSGTTDEWDFGDDDDQPTAPPGFNFRGDRKDGGGAHDNDYDFSDKDEKQQSRRRSASFLELSAAGAEPGALEKLQWLVKQARLELGVQALEDLEITHAAQELDALLSLYNSAGFAACGDAVARFYSRAYCGLCNASFPSHTMNGTLVLDKLMCSEVWKSCALQVANITSYERRLSSRFSRLQRTRSRIAQLRSLGPGSAASPALLHAKDFLNATWPEPLEGLASAEQLKAEVQKNGSLPWCHSFLPSLTSSDSVAVRFGRAQAIAVEATEREGEAVAANTAMELRSALVLMANGRTTRAGDAEGGVDFAADGAGASDVTPLQPLKVVNDDPDEICPTYPNASNASADDVLVAADSSTWCIAGHGANTSLPVSISFQLVGNLTGVPARQARPIPPTATEGDWHPGIEWTATVGPEGIELSPTEELASALTSGVSLTISPGVVVDACGRVSAPIVCFSSAPSPTRVMWDRFGIRELVTE